MSDLPDIRTARAVQSSPKVTFTVTLERVEFVKLLDSDPDLSWLDQTDDVMGEGEGFEDWAAERKSTYGDEWVCVGVRAVAVDTHGARYESAGCWGIESDSGAEHFDQVAADELALLGEDLGVSLDSLPTSWVEEV